MISRSVLGTLNIPLLILSCILAVSGLAQTNDADSVVSLEADAAGLSLLSSDDIPTSGTFWIVTSPTNDDNDITPPYPFLPPNLASDSVYVMANGIFLVDDTAGDAGASAPEVLAQVDAVSNLIVQVQATTTVQTSRAMGVRTMDDSGPSDFTDTNGDGGDFDYSSYPSLPPINTNLLWLQITNVADGFAYLNLNNATDTVYAIFSTTNLPGGWQVETEIWPYGAGIVPFTINTANRGNLFFWAEDWTDFETNGLPAWWTWQNFGNLDYSASELDSLGSNTLGYDYTNNINPNQFVFSLQVSNNYVDNANVSVQFNITNGVPAQYAVLINATNFDVANWQPFTGTNINVYLGSDDGTYNVLVGLRGSTADQQPVWQGIPLTLNTVPLVITITNPIASEVSQSLIQIQGFASEPLSQITFDVSNAAGIFLDQTGYVTGEGYDTNLLKFTTNFFQCYDVQLTNGANLITLHAFDLANDETSAAFSYTVVYSTNPPLLSLVWPQPNTEIGGTNFTLQATVNEVTADVIASITDTNGDTNTVTAEVERNGNVWVSDLPLAAGTNTVTLTAINEAGIVSMTNFMVVKSAVNLNVDPISSGQLNQASVTVTGTVTPGQNVYVNGTQASVDGSGNWTAINVTVNPTGTVNLNVTAGTDSSNIDSAQSLNQQQPSLVQVAGYQETYITTQHSANPDYPPAANVNIVSTEIENWSFGVGGLIHDDYYDSSGGSSDTLTDWLAANPPVAPWQYAMISQAFYSAVPTEDIQGHLVTEADSIVTTASTLLQLATTGLATSGNRLVRLVMMATDANGNPLAPSTFQLLGQTFMPTATNANAGEMLIAVPNGATPSITLDAPAPSQYTFTLQSQDEALTLFANGQDLSTNTPEFCVGQATTNLAVFNPPLPSGTKVTYQWAASPDFVNVIAPPATNEASITYSLNIGVLTNSIAPIWWCTGGYKYLYCTAAVQLPNGQTATVIGRGNVAVESPFISDFEDDPPSYATNYLDNGSLYLQLGDDNSHGDMNYEVDVLSSYQGQTAIVQLINRTASNGSFGSGTLGTGGQYWLDSSYPYLGPFTVQAFIEYPLYFSDNPGVVDVASGLTLTTSCADQFRDYVIFRPSIGVAANNIFVTLGVVSGGNPSWGWSASTTWFGSWSTPTGSVTRPTNPDNSDTFPTWLHTYHNSQ